MEEWINSKYTEVYVKGVNYEGLSWTDDPDVILQKIADEVAKINDLSYLSLAVTASQVLATSQTPAQYTEMVVFFKNVKFKNKGYLDLENATLLRNSLKQALSNISGLGYSDVEIRTNSMDKKVYRR